MIFAIKVENVMCHWSSWNCVKFCSAVRVLKDQRSSRNSSYWMKGVANWMLFVLLLVQTCGIKVEAGKLTSYHREKVGSVACSFPLSIFKIICLKFSYVPWNVYDEFFFLIQSLNLLLTGCFVDFRCSAANLANK